MAVQPVSKSASVLLFAVLIAFCKPGPGPKPVPESSIPDGIILVIGDGMGLSFISQASLESSSPLSLESMPIVGLQKTFSLTGSVTDSAAAITAMTTGYKTYNGWLGLDGRGNSRPSIFNTASDRGWNTAILCTSSVTHATPAGPLVHITDRGLDREIALQIAKNPPNVLIGGGRMYFNGAYGESPLSILEDKGYEYHTGFPGSKKECSDLCDNAAAPLRYVALLADTHMAPALVRDSGDGSGSYKKELRIPGSRGPILREISVRTIRTLLRRRTPFLVLIEGSQIDWGGHENDARYAMNELLDLDRTIAAIREEIKGSNILLIVTADHEVGGHAIMEGTPGKPQSSAFLTHHHTGTMVPVFAEGPGAFAFSGIYDNAELYHKMLALFEARSRELQK